METRDSAVSVHEIRSTLLYDEGVKKKKKIFLNSKSVLRHDNLKDSSTYQKMPSSLINVSTPKRRYLFKY